MNGEGDGRFPLRGVGRETAVTTLLPLVMGFLITFFVTQIWRLAAGV